MQLWFVVSGAVAVTINGTKWVLYADSAFMVPPGTS
jgi:mannose-6-phosphate isomerase-like protein (cupin superfamily)